LLNGKEGRELLHRAHELFFGDPDEEFVDWLYIENPAGHAFCNMALDDHKIAGQYIVIPLDFVIGGRDVKGSLSLNTFTHPDYRRQGIFTILANELYDHLAANGVRFTVGLPNEASRHGFVGKLKFTEPIHVFQSMRALALSSSWGPMVRRASGNLPFGFLGLAVRKAKRLDFDMTNCPKPEWLDELWMNYRVGKAIELKKDARWVRWRYENHPHFAYRFLTATRSDGSPAGYAVWSETRQRSGDLISNTLMDVVAVDIWSYFVLVQTFLCEIAPSCDIVKAMSAALSMYGNILLAMGFIPYSSVSFIVRQHTPRFQLKPYFKKGIWHVSSCYADFV
jgi:GNAT superfamily N-acetyltransferase